MSESEKHVAKVGTAISKKRSSTKIDRFVSKIASNIRPKDIWDDIDATIRKATWDVFTGILDNILWPGGEGAPKRKTGDRTSYSSYYRRKDRKDDRSDRNEHHSESVKARKKCNYDDVIASSRADAEAIVKELIDALEQYGTASVGDLYDAAGLDCPHTYYSYGWSNLDDLEITRVRGGYLIDLPPAKSLIR